MALPRSRPRDLLLVVRILVVAASVPALMRLSLSRLERILAPRRVVPVPPPEEVRALAERIDALLLRGRPFVRSGCLTRGVTMFTFLSRAGAPVDLLFGIGKPDGGFAGHCWLSVDGEPFLERTDPRELFTEVSRFHHGVLPSRR